MKKTNLKFLISNFLLLLILSSASAEGPQWWQDRGVLNNQPAHDFNPVNQGQLKWMCQKAYEEFQAKLPGEANTNILNQINAFPVGNNFRPANQGMLKTLAFPFYERLIEEGYAVDFPWVGKTAADYALANQGQLKNLFYFDFDRFAFSLDTDGDGVSDALELLGKVYQAIPGTFTWEEAKADAERLGGHLATITTEQEQSILYQCVGNQAFYDHHLRIGAEDIDGDGQWAWITGESFDYSRWGTERPLAGANRTVIYNRNYTRQKKGQLWYDVGINGRYGYLLELPVTLDPRSNDTDGDGVNDFDEICLGGNPTRVDTDGDGISDAEEIAAGTSPAQIDTDFDGLTDVEELAGSTDPVNADTDGDGLMDGPEVYGSLYLPVFDLLHWHGAKTYAESLGGHLATVTSDAEHLNIVRTLGYTLMNRYNFWLGASDETLEGDWQWVTGENFETTRWYRSGSVMAPDNSGNEDFLEYYRGGVYQWNDINGSLWRSSLVELDAVLDPLNPDCDGDGIPDGEEISKGMNPLSLDSDGDGISDADEIVAGLNGGLADSDFDGLNDADEIALETDPLNPDSDGDGVFDGEERFITLTDPQGETNAVLSLFAAGSSAIVREQLHISTEYIEEGDDLINTSLIYGPAVTWSITNNTPGMYRLALQIEPYSKVQYNYYRYPLEISINDIVIGETLAVTDRGELAEGFIYTPWLEPGVYDIKCRFKWFMQPAGQDVRIHGLELYSITGTSDTNQNGLADWIDARLNSGMDSDGDGLSDKDELFSFGTDSLNADTDGDGLNDQDEVTLGADPLDSDSDDDGVSDGDEVNELYSNVLKPEFDGSVTNLLVLPGAATNRVTGSWKVTGTALQSQGRRGEVEYKFSLPEQDMVQLELKVAHSWKASLSAPIQTEDTSTLDFYVDGMYLGSRDVVSTRGASADVHVFLPILPLGEHTLTVFWENLHRLLVLKIDELSFQQLGGPDANSDGVKDWVQASLVNSTSVDSSLQSVVSPVCLEGAARYVPLMNITSDSSEFTAYRGVGGRWYTDIPLRETGETPVSVSFQSETLTRSVQAEWVSFNMLQAGQSNLTVRVGDSVKLMAVPEGWGGGQFTLTLNGVETRSPNCDPVIYTFDQAGSYVIHGNYRHDANQSMEGDLTVTVVDWSFSEDMISCRIGDEHQWLIPDLPLETVVETDPTITLIQNNSTNFTILPSEVNGEHIAVARLYEGGPVLDTMDLQVFWLISNADGRMSVIEHYEDSELWEAILVGRNLPDDFSVLVDVFAGGVVLDDYTVERWLTAEDFDEIGEYSLRLFHPNDRAGSTCYRLDFP